VAQPARRNKTSAAIAPDWLTFLIYWPLDPV